MKNTHNHTLTIGIPAHNEGKNIYKLLKSIKNQVQTKYILKQVILVLDGSKDNSRSVAKRSKLNILHIHQFVTRQGKSKALQYIQSNSKTDSLLLFDADVEILDNDFINKLIEPIVSNRCVITSAKVIPKKPNNFFTKMLYVSNQYKQELYESWNNGNNLYTCHGRAICMGKKLYPHVKYEGIVADDAQVFITSQQLGMNYKFVKEAKVYYKLPQTFKDHAKQSARFLQNGKQFSRNFKAEFVKKLYTIPLNILVPVTLRYLLRKPIHMTLYIMLFIYLKINSFIQRDNNSVWAVAESSKIW